MAEQVQHYEPQFTAHPPPVPVLHSLDEPPPLMASYNVGQRYEPSAEPPYHPSSGTSHPLSGSHGNGMEMDTDPSEPLPPPLMGPPSGHLSRPLQHGLPVREEFTDPPRHPPPIPEEYLGPRPQRDPASVHVTQREYYHSRVPEGHHPHQEPFTYSEPVQGAPVRGPPVQGPVVDGFVQPPPVPHDHLDAPCFTPAPTRGPPPPQDPIYVPPGYPVGPPMGIEVPSIPEVKKKVLPAWLREGLEKVAKDKQKQQEQEEKKKAMDIQSKEGSRWGDDANETRRDDEEEEDGSSGGEQEHAPSGQPGIPLSVASRPRGILKKAPPSAIQVEVTQEVEKEEEEEEEEGEESGDETDRVVEKLSDEDMVSAVVQSMLHKWSIV